MTVNINMFSIVFTILREIIFKNKKMMSFIHSIIKNKNAPLTKKVRERYNLIIVSFFKEPKNDSTNFALKSQGRLFISHPLHSSHPSHLRRHLRPHHLPGQMHHLRLFLLPDRRHHPRHHPKALRR